MFLLHVESFNGMGSSAIAKVFINPWAVGLLWPGGIQHD